MELSFSDTATTLQTGGQGYLEDGGCGFAKELKPVFIGLSAVPQTAHFAFEDLYKPAHHLLLRAGVPRFLLAFAARLGSFLPLDKESGQTSACEFTVVCDRKGGKGTYPPFGTAAFLLASPLSDGNEPAEQEGIHLESVAL